MNPRTALDSPAEPIASAPGAGGETGTTPPAPGISVVMPVLNEARFIEAAVRSLLAQRGVGAGIEVLAVDGGSSDGTRHILGALAAEDARVRVVDNPRRVTPVAFNLGIAHARGEWIGFFGAHASYAPDYAAACIEEMRRHRAVGCSGRVQSRPADGTRSARLVAWALSHPFGSSGSSVRTQPEGEADTLPFPVYDKATVVAAGGFNEALLRNQDNDLCQRLRARGGRLWVTWSTEAAYFPPADLVALARYAFRGGWWNARSLAVNAGSMRIRHLVPAVFVVALGLGVLMAIAALVCAPSVRPLLLAPLLAVIGSYGALAALSALQVAIAQRAPLALALPAAFALFHTAYGIGTLFGFARPRRLSDLPAWSRAARPVQGGKALLHRVNPSPFLRDLLLTTAASLGTGLALVAVTRLAAHLLGPMGFGHYAIARRFIAAAVPVLTLSMGVAIARNAALVRDPRPRRSVLRAGMALALVPTLLACAVLLAARRLVGSLVFGGEAPPGLVEATLLFLPGMAVFTVLFAWYRGTGRMGRGNLWQVAVVGVAPAAIAWWSPPGTGVVRFLAWLSLPLYAAAIPLAVFASRRTGRALGTGPLLGAVPGGALRELARYGIPRVPGGLALACLLGASAFLAPHLATVQDAGYLAVGQAVFALADAALASLGLLVLPRAAQLLAEGRRDFLRSGTSDIAALSVHLGLFAGLQMLVWADTIVLAWLGPLYVPAVPLMRVQLCALVPYLIYTLLRSVVDALETRAINTLNVLIALGVTIIACTAGAAFGWGGLGLALGTAVGLLALGFLTLRYLWQGGWIAAERLHLRRALILNLLFVAVALLARSVLVGRASPLGLLVLAAGVETILVILYWLVMRRLRPCWVGEIERRLIQRAAV